MTATGHSAATGRPPRLSFSVSRAISGSKRRWLVAVLVVVLVGGAVGGLLELRSTTPFRATRPLTSAFAKQNATELGGRPQASLGDFAGVRFIASAPFQLGIFLTNEASQPVTLRTVRAVFPRDSVVQQHGPALLAVWDPPPCPAGAMCPARGGIDIRCHPGEACNPPRPGPLQIAPGKAVVVQLNFRFLGCPQARDASLQDVRGIDVTYRDPAGALINQRLGLAASTLKIVTPRPCSK